MSESESQTYYARVDIDMCIEATSKEEAEQKIHDELDWNMGSSGDILTINSIDVEELDEDEE